MHCYLNLVKNKRLVLKSLKEKLNVAHLRELEVLLLICNVKWSIAQLRELGVLLLMRQAL